MNYERVTANQALFPAYFQGRWVERRLGATPVLYSTNLGAEFDVLVEGAGWLAIELVPRQVALPNWLAVQIDGLPYQRFPITAATIRLTLDRQPHVIRVVMSGNTDGDPVWAGHAGFAVKGVRSDGQLTPVRLGRREITFIGDSITAGCWVTGRQPGEDYRAETNYAAVASDALNARNVRIAYSAAGLSRGGTGGVPPLGAVLTAIDGATPWQPAATDLVVVNVGTNDGGQSGDEFAVTLRTFLNQVLDLYPATPLAVVIPFNQRFDRTIRRVMAAMPVGQLIETAYWQPSLTDQVHPDLAGSRIAGQRLAAALRQRYPQLFDD
ncbi:SGNH/GDSL hydrolase family protein [Lactiplantibacillus plajomi]|uniref:SGNH/GDSL hydrolase family protein n=1 Tax=Lactiplantibacillus plajomi TaxID=1457217 RepID=A0ABV6K9B6_9LACO|nr:SGNH/GDSL hydrolase family protein [Lactiplantibacillus plajomi]